MSRNIELVASNQEINLNHLVKSLRVSGYEVVSSGFNRLLVKPSGSSAPKKEVAK